MEETKQLLPLFRNLLEVLSELSAFCAKGLASQPVICTNGLDLQTWMLQHVATPPPHTPVPSVLIPYD